MTDIRDRTREVMILRSRDHKEGDRLLSAISLEEGPLTLIAKGAGKPASSLRSLALPFSRSQMLLSPAKGGISFVKGGEHKEVFVSLEAGLDTFAYASYLSELLLTVWPQGKVAPELYYLTQAAFSMLKLGEDPRRTARMFELRLLFELGWLGDLEACAECGQELSRRRFVLSPKSGQLLCEVCAAQTDPGAPLVSAGCIQTMRRLLELPFSRIPSLGISPAIHREMDAALSDFLAAHLDYRGRVRPVLEQLLG